MSEHDREARGDAGAGEGGFGWNIWVGALLLLGAAVLTGYLAAANARAPDGPEANTDSARAVRAALDACGSRSFREKRDCYLTALSRRLRDDGVRAAMATLEGLYVLDEDVERDAHVYAHHIGIEGYSLGPGVAETFSECSDMFSSGCYHGVIQAYFEHHGAVDSATVNGLCDPYKGNGQSRWILFQCLHGMGHGLTMHYDHHLLRALEKCDLLRENWDRRSCYGGAFMENLMAATAPHHPATTLAMSGEDGAAASGSGGDRSHGGHDEGGAGGRGAGAGKVEMASPDVERDPSGLYAPGSSFKALDRDDPHYPCSIVDARYLHACYQMQTSAMLHFNGGDMGDAARSCLDAPAAWHSTCFQSLGRDITAWSLQDAGQVVEECGKVREGAHRAACYEGAVKALVDWRSAPEPGFELCRKVEGEDYKGACYEALGEEIAVLVAGAGERAALCDESEAGHVDRCRRGARLPVARTESAGGAP